MRRGAGGRELRTFRDNGIPTLTNRAGATGVQTDRLIRSNAGPRNDVPTLRGEGRMPVGGEAHPMGGAPDGMNVNSGAGNDRALRVAPSTTALRGTASGRATLRDIDPGTPVPGAQSHISSIPAARHCSRASAMV